MPVTRVLHPDALVGVLAGVAHRLGHAIPHSLERADVFRGRRVEELFTGPDTCPPVTRRHRWRVGRLWSEDVAFPSLYEPVEPAFAEAYRAEYRRCHTVRARRLIPPGAEGRPRLIYVHGYMQPETPIEELVIVGGLARALGAEVWHIQPPHHGRRRARGSRFTGEHYWTSDVVRSVEALRQTVIDVRTLLTVMLAEDDRPVGIAGLSLGGTIAAAATCLDARLAFSAPMIAHMDLGELLRDAPVLGRMRRELAEQGWGPEDFGALWGAMGFSALTPALPADRIQLFAAEHDRFFPADKVRAMAARWGDPPIAWYPTSHMGFVARLPWAARVLRRLVDRV